MAQSRLAKWLRRAVFVTVLGVCALGVGQALMHPDTPLPDAWNPTQPFAVADDITPLTDWKLRALLATPGACVEATSKAADIAPRPPLEAGEQCFIRDRVRVASVGSADVRDFETTCHIALKLALWERHVLRPAALEIFGQDLREIRHFDSYNCRRIRTSRGVSDRWSTHATARAVDVSGFVLTDGTLIDLRQHWDDDGDRGVFLRRAQQGACDIFGLVLGPEYNALHADHFHIQLDGQGCR
ncbi:MAG: extensin family protein [Pseudomonadota bacterium]